MIWDAEALYEGEDDRESFRAWGMLDPGDSDYVLSNEEAYYDARFFKPTPHELKKIVLALGCPIGVPLDALYEALIEVMGG